MTDTDTQPVNEELKQDETPAGLQRRWKLEIDTALREFEDFHNDGAAVVDEFLGKGSNAARRFNLFFSDVETKSANLSGTPKVRAKRRYADARDDVARVSAAILDRLLNTDIKRESDGYRDALQNAKGDWLKPGLGQIRLRYVVENEDAKGSDGEALQGEDGQPLKRKVREDVETDYQKWRRFLWSPCEVWDSDVRWVAYGLDLTKEEWDRQFPGKPFHAKAGPKDEKDEAKRVFGRAEVWEIWDKDTKRVLFFADQQLEILAVKPDPYGLPGFFPSPRPLMANATTSKCVPRSTYYLAKPLYDEAHELHQRIRGLVRRARVVGAYDKANEGLQKLLDDTSEGKLIPVANWSSLVEKGGLQGAIAFMPLKEIIEAILALSQRLEIVQRELYQVTGQADIMRGQAAERATATEQRIKARFGSSRIQKDQDELARFASEAQQIRAFLIAKLFDAETIIKRSNIEQAEVIEAPAPAPVSGQPPSPPQLVPNRELIEKAVALLKSDIAQYEIDVDAESLTMTDFDAVQQEGVAIMQATAEFFAKFAPLMQGNAQIGQFVLELYQQMIGGFRGSERFEGLIERGIAQLKAAASAPKPPPPPDPKLEAAKVKAQADIAGTRMDMQAKQLEHGARMQEIQAEMVQDRARTQNEMARTQAASQAGLLQAKARAEAAQDFAPPSEGGF